jgi:hypothetical protein
LELKKLTALVRKSYSSNAEGQLIRFIEAYEPHSYIPKTLVEDFEELVGAMYDRYLDLKNLSDIATESFGEDDSRALALSSASEVIWKINRNALAAALRVIWLETTSKNVDFNPIDTFVAAVQSEFENKATFFTVNYDTLLIESLLRVYGSSNIFDLAASKRFQLNLSSGHTIHAQEMRRSMDDFGGLGERVGLIHLHGSLSFWRSGLDGPDFKLHKSGIADANLLLHEVEKKGSFRPLVLFGRWPSKWQVITQFPFSLAYESLRKKLEVATHLLIAGLSLREPAILEMIGITINETYSEGRKIKIFLVDVIDVPKEEFIERVSTYVSLDSMEFDYSSTDFGVERIASSIGWLNFIEN